MLNSAHLTERLSFQFTIFIAQLLKQGEKQAENQPSDKHYSSFRGAEALLFPHGTLAPSQEWVWFCYFFSPQMLIFMLLKRKDIVLCMKIIVLSVQICCYRSRKYCTKTS